MRRNVSRIHMDPNFVKVIGHVWVHVDLLSPLIEKLPYYNLKGSFRYDERNMESNIYKVVLKAISKIIGCAGI